MNNDARKLLNIIYSTLKESQAGYQECAENVENRTIREKFAVLSAKHQQMIDALEEEAALLGEKVAKEDSETLLGKAHKLLSDIKSLVASDDIPQLLTEIEREEGHLINDYKSVLKHTLPFDLEILLKYQSNEIEKDFVETKKFHHAYEIAQRQRMANTE